MKIIFAWLPYHVLLICCKYYLVDKIIKKKIIIQCLKKKKKYLSITLLIRVILFCIDSSGYVEVNFNDKN